ncbi:hypothetical protein OS493_035129 [Desmophyllum pertusum]|uniref:Uncharacterized protein n=1 Tax=Desmophyllum pertusum TaxID=174260 RepID=A0A9X0CPZ9_9CNID|nr:hypothetical protein OS493_035129 [Desmophyllum pertusum]
MLLVNVNGKKYTISGLTRGTCSKQILCALAKVDAELQATRTLAQKSESLKEALDCACAEQGKKPKQVRESRKKVKREEKCSSHKEAVLKANDGRKSTSRKTRSTKKIVESDNKGIQTSSGMPEASEKAAESQQSCLPTIHEQEDLKEKVLENCLQTVEEFVEDSVERDAEHAENKVASGEDQSKDTDHDTGISELHSDSSFELSQILHNTEKVVVSESAGEKTVNRATSHITVKCASTNTDPMEPVDNTDARMPENETVNSPHECFIVAELIGSETDVEMDDECTCVYVDSGSEELQEEIEKVRGDLKSTEAKLIEQNKTIEMLNSLIVTDELNAKEFSTNTDVNTDVTADVNKRIDELKQSIKFSNQLYGYQKLETQANALELDRVESQIRRKRWHVESLLKELHSVRNNSPHMGGGQGRSVNYLREGTLV